MLLMYRNHMKIDTISQVSAYHLEKLNKKLRSTYKAKLIDLSKKQRKIDKELKYEKPQLNITVMNDK